MIPNRGMIINPNHYNYTPELEQREAYNRELKHRHVTQSSQSYNNSWYVRETAENGPEAAPTSDDEPESSSCGCWSKKETKEQQLPMRCNNPARSSSSMVASYGVYHDTGLHTVEEEGGFIPRANVYRGVVVNAAGDSSVVRPGEVSTTEESSCGWCVSSASPPATSTPEESCWVNWCRPTVLLIILVLLVIIFMFVSGLLLYFNCKFTVSHVLFCFRCFLVIHFNLFYFICCRNISIKINLQNLKMLPKTSKNKLNTFQIQLVYNVNKC